MNGQTEEVDVKWISLKGSANEACLGIIGSWSKVDFSSCSSNFLFHIVLSGVTKTPESLCGIQLESPFQMKSRKSFADKVIPGLSLYLVIILCFSSIFRKRICLVCTHLISHHHPCFCSKGIPLS